ncbi:hypothetical protein [Myroides odoratimimus]|uniref:hypothetical protein n=1 Tax=Myroides odoratimimus TaxID=76832 RepID=UPI000468CE3E|nr:hypothetical protein [Myroides odoratimimus]
MFKNGDNIFRRFSNVLLISLVFCCFLGCSQPPKDGHYKAVSFSKVDNSLMFGATLGYMEFIAEVVPYLKIEDGDVITDFPIKTRESLENFKSFTGATYNDGRSLLDSIYKVQLKNDTLMITFHYVGTSQPTKDFVFKYLPISKEEYDEGVKKLFLKQEEVKHSFTTMDLSNLDYTQKRPAYLKDYKSMVAMENMFSSGESTKYTDQIYTSYRTVDLRTYKDTTYDYKEFQISNSEVINKSVANIDDLVFNDFYVYVDTNMETQGIVLEKKEWDKKSIKELFVKLKEKNKNAELSFFGLPQKDKDGEISNIAQQLAVKWKDDLKSVTLIIDDIPESIRDTELYKKAFITDKDNSKKLIDNWMYYLNLIEQANVKVYIISPSFDEVIRGDDENHRQQIFHGEPILKVYEYVWRGYYEWQNSY